MDFIKMYYNHQCRLIACTNEKNMSHLDFHNLEVSILDYKNAVRLLTVWRKCLGSTKHHFHFYNEEQKCKDFMLRLYSNWNTSQDHEIVCTWISLDEHSSAAVAYVNIPTRPLEFKSLHSSRFICSLLPGHGWLEGCSRCHGRSFALGRGSDRSQNHPCHSAHHCTAPERGTWTVSDNSKFNVKQKLTHEAGDMWNSSGVP